MDDGPLDRAGLDRELARAGLPAMADQARDRRLGTDPWALTTYSWRGDLVTTVFDDEDTACRAALLDALLTAGLPGAEGRWDDLDRRPLVTATGPASPPPGPPEWRWARALRAGSGARSPSFLAQHDGVVAIVDTEALWRHGSDGAVLLTAIDARSGEVRWSTPVVPAGLEVLTHAGLLLVHVDGRLTSYDLADGRVRWTRPFPGLDSVAGLGGGTVALHADTRGGPVVGLDVATGAERYVTEAPPPTWEGRPRTPPAAWWTAEVDAGVLRLVRTDVADGQPHVEATLPHRVEGLDGATLIQVVEHPVGVARRFLRVRSARRHAVGLLVVSPDGSEAPRWADPAAGAARETRTVPVDADHVLTTGRAARDGRPSRMSTLDGRMVWERPDLLTVLHREPGLTVCQRRDTVEPQNAWARQRHDDLVVAIDDDGHVVWQADLGPAAVAGDELWHCPRGQVGAVRLRDGARRWVVPSRRFTPWPVGLAAVETLAASRHRGDPAVLATGTTLVGVR
ncbi:PQQ-binding-like beta-propeller repeat protein [Nocardioides litoris]|uniref:outer membrane protein assembly factor BamB family protein n=1 Tax=Nocardioides litoris TaxID=1926648 RepID=UPI001121192E|nr:PQQ-binding-like beta-propeller repeat protein [Nocardioides litoris]